MKFLLTNDDGIDAPGLAVLQQAVRGLGEPVIVSPADHHSGCSHRVTTNEPVRIEPRGERSFAIYGTPADCVRVGLDRIVPDARWILSGINQGGNLGADVYYSGTVAAVREGVLHGWPGVALSHFRARGREYDWPRVTRWATHVLQELLGRHCERGSFWNVNFPHLLPEDPDPEMVFCPLDPSPLPLSFRHEADASHYSGDYHNRAREPGCDVDVCFRGKIAITLIRLF